MEESEYLEFEQIMSPAQYTQMFRDFQAHDQQIGYV